MRPASVLLVAAVVLGAVGVLVLITLVYTSLSGLWGVVATDVLQFAVALIGAIVLATLSVQEVGGLHTLVEKITANAKKMKALNVKQVCPSHSKPSHDNVFKEVFGTGYVPAILGKKVPLEPFPK